MINRIAIKEAFEDALKKSKEEYENNVINTLENYIEDKLKIFKNIFFVHFLIYYVFTI